VEGFAKPDENRTTLLSEICPSLSTLVSTRSGFFLLSLLVKECSCFTGRISLYRTSFSVRPTTFYLSDKASSSEAPPAGNSSLSSEAQVTEDLDSLQEEQKKELVGNLVADDEWVGLSMELAELVRTAVMEDIKAKTRDFIGKDEYKIGDISKEVDARVKNEIAQVRGKEEYELGDLALAMDKVSKEYTEQLTGRPYETGDLSKELDKRIKERAAEWCGKETYEFGDLSRELDRRVKNRVEEFTGKAYEFGDITREINERRKDWIRDYLGSEAAERYEFGDLTKKAVSRFTGKDKYEFGDVTKKVLGGLFGGKREKGDSGALPPGSKN